MGNKTLVQKLALSFALGAGVIIPGYFGCNNSTELNNPCPIASKAVKPYLYNLLENEFEDEFLREFSSEKFKEKIGRDRIIPGKEKQLERWLNKDSREQLALFCFNYHPEKAYELFDSEMQKKIDNFKLTSENLKDVRNTEQALGYRLIRNDSPILKNDYPIQTLGGIKIKGVPPIESKLSSDKTPDGGDIFITKFLSGKGYNTGEPNLFDTSANEKKLKISKADIMTYIWIKEAAK